MSTSPDVGPLRLLCTRRERQETEGPGPRTDTGKCIAAGCFEPTRHHKPYCKLHIHLMPYVQAMPHHDRRTAAYREMKEFGW